jgi:ectoine hydroxylase-related dioxygenase (phytanoyl-CoA dioxygenase family)
MKKRKDSQGNDEVYYEGERPEFDISKGVPLEVKKGDAVIFHSENVHYAFANKSDKT